MPNYWILDGFGRSLECLRLEAGAYRVDVAGRHQEQLRPSLFPELTIALGSLWED